MTRKYSSFDEIDQHLKVLKLEREIYRESVKLGLARAKVDLHPLQMARTMKGTMHKWMLTFLVNILRSRFPKPNPRN